MDALAPKAAAGAQVGAEGIIEVGTRVIAVAVDTVRADGYVAPRDRHIGLANRLPSKGSDLKKEVVGIERGDKPTRPILVHVALAEIAGRGQPTVTPEDVTKLAKQGEPLARKTVGMFFAMLGTVAGDLALTSGARGGVYIAGGIVPRLVEPLMKSEFRARFEAKGRYRDYLAAIPTYLITAPLPAFRGLRHLLGYR